jgi:hypothetical protein
MCEAGRKATRLRTQNQPPRDETGMVIGTLLRKIARATASQGALIDSMWFCSCLDYFFPETFLAGGTTSHGSSRDAAAGLFPLLPSTWKHTPDENTEDTEPERCRKVDAFETSVNKVIRRMGPPSMLFMVGDHDLQDSQSRSQALITSVCAGSFLKVRRLIFQCSIRVVQFTLMVCPWLVPKKTA